MKTNKYLSMLCALAMVACSGKTDPETPGENPGESEPQTYTPALPKDNSDQGITYKVFYTDFTGTGCVGCPQMMTALRKVMANADIAQKVELAISHEYNNDDPAYFSGKIGETLGVSQYPTLAINMHDVHTSSITQESKLKEWANEAYNKGTKAGISAATEVKDGKLLVNLEIKALESGKFRVGAWVLEDNIYGVQKGTADELYFTHDNCVRYADSKTVNSYAGIKLGDLNAGEKASHLFSIDIDKNWKQENCRVLVFVSAAEGTKYVVTNVASTNSLTDTIQYKR